MYVIKMKTLICYFAVFVLLVSAFGMVRFFDAESAETAASASAGEYSGVDVSSADGTESNEPSANGASGNELSADGMAGDELSTAKKERIDVPILMYHNICKSGGRTGRYIISVTEFENDLKFIAENGYTTVVMQDLIDYVYNGKKLPKKPVVLTFDDGYFNNYAYAFPLLEKYDARAVLSIIGYYTDLYTKTPDENPAYSHVTWDNVRELMKSGRVELQNHSYNLHSTDKGRNGSKKKRGESLEHYRAMLTEDLGTLQKEFKENTKYTPTTYTYPFGSVSNDSFQIVKDMGFKASLSCESGMNHVSRDPECLYMMKRYLRTPSKTAKDILK